MTKTLTLLTALAATLPAMLPAPPDYPESWYQAQWCKQHHGQTEVVLSDKTRVDCVTDTHAIEFDFGPNWAQSIGQALGYSIETLKQPGIVLIIEKPEHYKYWIKLNTVIDYHHLPIKTWKLVL